MAPKICSDEDGDIPPCSVMDNYAAAKRWDDWKQEKYGGKQKAEPAVDKYKHMWAKPVSVPPAQHGTKCIPFSINPFKWLFNRRT
jgi:hypothetical protein